MTTGTYSIILWHYYLIFWSIGPSEHKKKSTLFLSECGSLD